MEDKVTKNVIATNFLGRIISRDGYRIDPKQVSALEKLRENPPTTVRELKQIPGFVGYYRRYVKSFSREMKILYDLLRIPETMQSSNRPKGHLSSKIKILWGRKHQDVLDRVITTLMSPPVMAFPDFEQPFILHTDASSTTTALILRVNSIKIHVFKG